MDSHARIIATSRRGAVVLTELRSAPPLTLRRTGPHEVAIVSSAAWPVGGDAVTIDIDIGPGAKLTVVSVAASLAHPSPSGAPSSFTVNAGVSEGAALHWLPEPSVLLAGCDHRATSRIDLQSGASLLWREEVRLGRAGESSGSLLQRVVIDRDGVPFLRNEIAVGPAWPCSLSPAMVRDGHVAIGTAIEVGSGQSLPSAQLRPDVAWSANPLADDATAWTALGTSMGGLRSTMGRLLRQGGTSLAVSCPTLTPPE